MHTAPRTHSLTQSLVTVHMTLTALTHRAQAACRAQADHHRTAFVHLVLSVSNCKMYLLSVLPRGVWANGMEYGVVE